ncbi:MAG: peptidylprolyl isomerase [Spirosomaceae bacterium]|jgi:peptidyl-prolyl cis-trans isomerase SurA|nr:peptidylprolyl isomerase [Spirosomataceae bacterium]
MNRTNTLLYILLLSQLACQTIQKATNKSKPNTNNTPTVVSSTPTSAKPEEPVIVEEPAAITLGNSEIKSSELKAQIEMAMYYDSLNPKEAIEQSIIEKRIELDAKKRGYDKEEDFVGELQTFRELNAKSYLTDSATIKHLIKETYEWSKQEIHAAHIFYNLSEFADPLDTIVIYNKLLDIRNRALAGEDFSKLAGEFSQDKKTAQKGGDLGWFTALQFIYPLEKAAYETSVGDISMPFRTKGGFHIIKVIQKRPYSGKVLAQHILKLVSPDNPEISSKIAKSSIDSIYFRLKAGEPFEELCGKYSDDYRTKNFGGFLPAFGIGTREEVAFEQAAFKLNVGEFSEPVKTSSGWHIIKLAKKMPLESFEEVYPKIKEKVVTDSRGDLVKENTLKRLKSQMNFLEDKNTVLKLFAKADSNILRKKWAYAFNDELIDKTLFSFSGKTVKGKEFFDYAVERNKSEKVPAGYTPSMIFRSYYKKFQDNLIYSNAEQNLEKVDKEFGALMSYYRSDLLRVRLLNDLVYEKSVADTSGQRSFYEQNKAKYQLPERVFATIISSDDSKNVEQVKDIFTKGLPYRLNRTVQGGPIFFKKSNSDLTNEHKSRLLSLLVIMKKNPGYIVEIGGHADVNEADSISANRMKSVIEFLTMNGLPVTRIIENDYIKTKPIDKFDWLKNQRITFQFYSTDKKDVVKVFSEKDVVIQEGYFKKGDSKIIDSIKWEVGNQFISKDGKFIEVLIDKIEPARSKTLRECRGEVINDWQKVLESQFFDDLAKKYPVKIHEEEIQKIIESVKNTKY